MFSLLLPLVLAMHGPFGAVQGPFDVTALHPPGGPTVLYHRQPTPLVALRLSVPLPADLPEGALELLQELALPEARATADRFGARLELTREGDSGVYRVTGPAEAFDTLAALLERAIGEPHLGAAVLARAQSRADERVTSLLERPVERLRVLLLRRLSGGRGEPVPAAGRLDPEPIRRLRRMLFRPDRLTLVVVADLPPGRVASAFSGWATTPDPDDAAERPLPPSSGSADPGISPQAYHDWAALGYPLEGEPAAVAVAAELVARRAHGSALHSGDAEAWLRAGRTVLVVRGAATPGNTAIATAAGIGRLELRDPDSRRSRGSVVGRYLRRMIAEAATLVSERAVEDAVVELRSALLLAARDPAGRAEVIGRLAGADGAAEFLAGLESVGVADVREVLDAALGMPAYLVEVRP